MTSLDEELAKRGLEKHPTKDELAVLNGTCLGIDLSDGLYVAPHAPRLAVFLHAVLEVLLRGEVSPKGMSAGGAVTAVSKDMKKKGGAKGGKTVARGSGAARPQKFGKNG